MGRPGVLLDRDGVINKLVLHPELGTVDSPATPDEFELLPGTGEAIARLNALHLPVAVVSNQPGLAKGRFSEALLSAVGTKMHGLLAEQGARVDAAYVCRHHPSAVVEQWRTACECRKPAPGLLMQAAEELDLDLTLSYMVGDGVSDVVAGAAVGATTILIGPRKLYVDHALQEHGAWPDHFAATLSDAVTIVENEESARLMTTLHTVDPKSAAGSGDYVDRFLRETHRVVDGLDRAQIEATVELLVRVRDRGGRLFFLGVGGGAGHASHAVNDFRKIAGIESYTPSDNVSELTARINDDDWETAYSAWLEGSRLCERDLIFVFSVGGGDRERGISTNLVRAMDLAKARGAGVCGVVGRDGGHCAQVADACIVIPVISDDTITPHTEGFQAVVWHLLVTHPRVLAHEMKWESSV